jgi:Coenzyme PQQ synthesis protein D (PqqD)
MFRKWMERIRRKPAPEGVLELRPSDGVCVVTAEDGLAILDFGRGIVFKANGVGSEIWRALFEERHDTGTVSRSIARRFGVPAEQVEGDVNVFLAQLEKEGLVSNR